VRGVVVLGWAGGRVGQVADRKREEAWKGKEGEGEGEGEGDPSNRTG